MDFQVFCISRKTYFANMIYGKFCSFSQISYHNLITQEGDSSIVLIHSYFIKTVPSVNIMVCKIFSPFSVKHNWGRDSVPSLSLQNSMHFLEQCSCASIWWINKCYMLQKCMHYLLLIFSYAKFVNFT